MTDQIRTFLISINVFEGKHFSWPDMDSFVLIRVGKKKKSTSVRHSTDCPYYNEVTTAYDMLPDAI